ncbi:MAG: hypothetical protein GC159_12895 [Phycisphaera sp.]|nr:hypothetical protein [Phycisphaera sp.]
MSTRHSIFRIFLAGAIAFWSLGWRCCGSCEAKAAAQRAASTAEPRCPNCVHTSATVAPPTDSPLMRGCACRSIDADGHNAIVADGQSRVDLAAVQLFTLDVFNDAAPGDALATMPRAGAPPPLTSLLALGCKLTT